MVVEFVDAQGGDEVWSSLGRAWVVLLVMVSVVRVIRCEPQEHIHLSVRSFAEGFQSVLQREASNLQDE